MTNSQLIHVRNVLENYLTDIPESAMGSNKSPVLNALSLSNAVLFVLNDPSDSDSDEFISLSEAGAIGKTVFASEIFPEGVPEYMSSESRNVTYSAVARYVHKYGIKNALPSMQSSVVSLMNDAINNNKFIPAADLPVEQYDERYLSLLLETFFGVWGHDPNNDQWAGEHEYGYINRESMSVGDLQAYNLIKGFFGENWSYTVDLPADFNGLFSVKHNPEMPYTNRSKYLKNIKISGVNNIDITGNMNQNHVLGNQGVNIFEGGGIGGGLEKIDWNGNVVWSYLYNSESYHQHHDIEPLPNGNILILAWEYKTAEEAVEQGRNPNLLEDNELWPEHIIEIEPVGNNDANIVWEWHLWLFIYKDLDYLSKPTTTIFANL